MNLQKALFHGFFMAMKTDKNPSAGALDEITEEMLDAGRSIVLNEAGVAGDILSGDFDAEKLASRVYRAMATLQPGKRCS